MDAVSDISSPRVWSGGNSQISPMKRTVKRLLLFVVLLALFTIVRFPYEDLLEDELSEIRRQAGNQGFFFELEDSSLRFPGTLEFERFGALIATRSLPVPLVLTRGQFELDFLPFLLLRAQVSGSAKAYGGEIETTFHRNVFGDDYSAHLEADSINLADHPSLKALGISGDASFDVAALISAASPPRSVEAELQINNGALSYPGKIAGAFAVPKLSALNLEISAEGDNGKYSLGKCQASSSHGSVSCGGTFAVNPAGIVEAAQLRIELALNELGRTEFGPYLALAGGARGSSTGGGAYTIDLALQQGVITKFAVTPG